VHTWLRSDGNGGIGDLPDRSSQPDRCPHQAPVEFEETIVTMCHAHPAWGPRRIQVEWTVTASIRYRQPA